jgi:hypothetical protein
MSLSNYEEARLLDLLVGKTAHALETIYVGLSTADPLDDASGLAEPVGNGYARVATTGATWEAAVAGAIQNASAITFAEASGDWGTLTHFALFDALSGGNMIASGALDTGTAITNGQIFRFAAGALDITLD